MAGSPAHRLGQIIGESLELAIEPVLRSFAEEHDLYLDCYGRRRARPGKKVSWTDANGNTHELDFVLERGGTDDKIGVPAAFIESAWRRYTKHSKNKAQEMQGAIEPLLLEHAYAKPFAGAVVGGQWTDASKIQMESVGFVLLHLSYDEIVAAFAAVGIDVLTQEDTPLGQLQANVDRYEQLDDAGRAVLGEALRSCAPKEFEEFRRQLAEMVVRTVSRVSLLPLHGGSTDYATTEEAIQAIEAYQTPDNLPSWVRWEVSVRFSNGDRIEAQFAESHRATDFLRSFD